MTHLIDTLTLEEKAGLVSGASFWRTRAVDRVGVRAVTLSDGPHGVRFQAEGTDHLGINASVPATAFPTASSLGSSWDPALAAEIGAALGKEARTLSVDVLLGPGVNIKRSPLCGRNFEYFSEDPLVSGILGAAWTEGVQGQGVGVAVKHFAANNQETDRMRVSADVDERTLRELYLPAFERIVREQRPSAVMCSYNRINGVFASEHRWLLTDVLRDEWGFDGYVVSDWGAVNDPVAALAAGTDLEMPSSGDRSPTAIAAAVEAGALDVALLDEAVRRILAGHDRIRETVFEDSPLDLDAHHELARRAAADGAVLLTNEGALLPLDPTSGGRIAVIGELARTPRYQGAGSSHVNPTRLDDAVTAIRAATTREVVFAPGFTLDGATDPMLLPAAVAAAAEAEVVVAFLGLPDALESEGFDRSTLVLPAAQLDLLSALLEVNPSVVVVLSNGGIVTIDPVVGRAPALLEMWLAGQASGSAVADVVFGAREPGGRLAETIPLKLTDTPAVTNWPGSAGHVLYGERLYVGYRWYDATDRAVAFPFGHGLGYTTFAYSGFEVHVPDPTVAGATVRVTVQNIGDRPGSEVVQVYVGDPVASVDRPVRELRAFSKVRLDPGEERTLSFDLDERSFAFWQSGGWTVEPGEFILEIGSSSRAIRGRAGIQLDVPASPAVLSTDLSLGEWMADPVGRVILSGFLAELGEAAGMLDDPATRQLAEPMPLPTIITMAGGSDGHTVVRALLATVTEAQAGLPR